MIFVEKCVLNAISRFVLVIESLYFQNKQCACVRSFISGSCVWREVEGPMKVNGQLKKPFNYPGRINPMEVDEEWFFLQNAKRKKYVSEQTWPSLERIETAISKPPSSATCWQYSLRTVRLLKVDKNCFKADGTLKWSAKTFDTLKKGISIKGCPRWLSHR